MATNTPSTASSLRSPVYRLRIMIAVTSPLPSSLIVLDLAVPLEGDLRVGERLVLHDLRRAQRVAAVDHGDVRGEAREEDRFLHRGVAAADDGDRLAAEEEAVAGGAGRDAVADQRALGRQAEQPRRRAGRDDQRAVLVLAVRRLTLNGGARRSTAVTCAADDLGAEALGLRAHLRHQLGPHDAVAKPGPVLDQRRQHQLAAGLEALDDERLEVGARRIEGRGQSGRAGADDDDV